MNASLATLSENFAAIAAGLLQPKTLPTSLPVSTDEARRTLRWLRNLEGLQEDAETWLLRGQEMEQAAKISHLHQLVSVFAAQLAAAHKKRAAIVRDTSVVDAISASGALAISAIEHVRDALPDNHPDIAKLDAALDILPESFDLRLMQSVERLLDLLARGVERLTDTFTDERSPIDRLVDLSNKIAATANKLRSIDQLEEKPREESIELAREILRRLKNMKFSDKPIEEMIDAGQINEKALLAAELNDLTESYKNLLSEAALTDPNILQDARVQAANDAVGKMAHSVKLMAAKEIPVSLAATQQISADITQMPEEWKGLEGRTMDRLSKTMESGLEQAMDQIMEQQQQQQEEEAQEAAQHHEHTTRRRKRKRRHQRGSSSGARQRKEMRDLTADDYALKQGRFREEIGHASAKVPMPKVSSKGPTKETEERFMQGLKPEDLEIIRQLGGSLKKLNNEVKDLKLPVTAVDANGKIAADDKNFAQRSAEQQQRDRDKPGGIKI